MSNISVDSSIKKAILNYLKEMHSLIYISQKTGLLVSDIKKIIAEMKKAGEHIPYEESSNQTNTNIT